MVFTKIYRHGDVILYKLEETVQATGIQKKEQLILAEGEVTGHLHKLEGDFDVLDYKPMGGDVKFVVNTTALLTHEEHDRILLDSGVYLKVSQVEYNPFTDLVKRVVD